MASPSSRHSTSQSHDPALSVRRILVALLLVLASSATFAQTTSTWTGGAGNWAPCPASGGTALWDTCSTNVYPDGNFNAVIDGGPVTLGTGDGISIDNLNLAPGESLIITPGYLDITGTSIVNNGSISVGSGNGLTVEGSTTVTLSGTGTVTITDTTAHIAGANGSPAFVNQQTIQGQGALGEGTLAITNQGTVNANAGTLTVQPSATGIVNAGTMEASSGSTLEIIYGVPGPFNNTGGTIEALSDGTVILSAGTYTGGTLVTAGTGTFTTPAGGSNPALNNLTLAGTFNVPSAASMTLEGTITNNGTIQARGELIVSGAVTLKGSGTTVVQGGTLQSTVTDKLTNRQLIHGYGTFDVVPLINQGTIAADSSTKTLTLAGETITNTATMEASGGGILTIQNNTTVVNSGGTIEALPGSTVNLAGTVSGGTLTTSGTGTIQSQNGILDGTLNAPTSKGKLDASTFDLFLLGTVNNTGTIALTAHSCIILNKPATLAGSGKLTMISTTCIFGSGNAFTNQSTIQGSGTIGDSNPMPIINDGTILANQTSPLSIVPDATGFTNNGKLMVSKGSMLNINGLFNNLSSAGTLSGGTYTVTGTLGVQKPVITNDAAITLTGASAEILNTSTSTNALSGLTANATLGSLSLQQGQALATSAGLSNTGKITVGLGSTLSVGGTYTQTAGTTTLDGTLTATTVTLQKGSLLGKGTLGGAVTSNTAIIAGDSTSKPGTLTLTGSYAQNSTGTLNISIGGSAAGKFGDLAVSNGVTLGGTLSIKLVNGFVPTIGENFTILTGSVVSNKFATVKGTSINSSEHFEVTYNATNVTLTVVSGA